MDVWRIAEVLGKRKWLLLFSVVAAAILTFGATRLSGSRWVATVSFMSPTPPLAVNGNQTSLSGEAAREEMKTMEAMYAAVITSREVMEPAYNKVREALPEGTHIFKDIEFTATEPRLYELRIYNDSPARAERIANALADSFVERNHSLSSQETARAVHLLQDQVHQADAALAKARLRYQDYSRKHQILGNPDDEIKVGFTELQAARLKQNQVQEDMATESTRLHYAEQNLAQVKQELSALPAAAPVGPSAKALADELDKVDVHLASLQTRYGDGYPEVRENIEARNTLLERLRKAAAAEAAAAAVAQKKAELALAQKAAVEARPRVAALTAQAAALGATMTKAEGRIHEAKQLSDPYGSLGNEIASLTQSRSALLARLSNAQGVLDQAQQQNPIVIMARVSDLNPPRNVTAGRTAKVTTMAALGALICVSALLMALDSLDRRLRTVSEVELLLPTRVLAAIPQADSTFGYASLARVSQLQPHSLQAEAYRFLGLHLLSVAGPNVRSLMVMSAKAEQGSTTTVTNLAITLAQAGNRVILVDANTRTPELHHVFETENGYGFTDLLMDPTTSAFEQAIMPTETPNLRMITSGSAPENPWELFRSENLVAVSSRLREMADYVLYDTPSGVLFTDAFNLAPVVDAAFLCVRAQETPTGAEERLIGLMNQANVNVIGAVLSHVQVSAVAGYENYQQHYAPATRALPTPPAPSAKAEANRIGISLPLLDIPATPSDPSVIGTKRETPKTGYDAYANSTGNGQDTDCK